MELLDYYGLTVSRRARAVRVVVGSNCQSVHQIGVADQIMVVVECKRPNHQSICNCTMRQFVEPLTSKPTFDTPRPATRSTPQKAELQIARIPIALLNQLA